MTPHTVLSRLLGFIFPSNCLHKFMFDFRRKDGCRAFLGRERHGDFQLSATVNVYHSVMRRWRDKWRKWSVILELCCVLASEA